MGLSGRARGLNKAILEEMTSGQTLEAEHQAQDSINPRPRARRAWDSEAVGSFTVLEGNPVRWEDRAGEVPGLSWGICYPNEGA